MEQGEHWGTVPPVECEILTLALWALHGKIGPKVGDSVVPPVWRSRSAASGYRCVCLAKTNRTTYEPKLVYRVAPINEDRFQACVVRKLYGVEKQFCEVLFHALSSFPRSPKQSSTTQDDHLADKKACGSCCTLRRKPGIQDRHLFQD